MAKGYDLTKFFCRGMAVLLNMLYFSVFLRHFILREKVKTKQKMKFPVAFLFLPFFGNTSAVEWWNVDVVLW